MLGIGCTYFQLGHPVCKFCGCTSDKEESMPQKVGVVSGWMGQV